MKMRRLAVISFGLFALSAALPAAAAECTAPPAVCAVAADVVGISSFEPVGSAVIISDGVLVTNRHMLADNAAAEVTVDGGARVVATLRPSAYPGDLVILDLPSMKQPQPLTIAKAGMDSTLYVIGFDVGRGAVRVYAPGQPITETAATPLARLHHDARALPGNSGGAVVDAEGRLVGIVASGGEGRNEAIPAADIEKLLAGAKAPDAAEVTRRLGTAYRQCTERLDDMQTSTGVPAPTAVAALRDACLATENRQMMDLAASALGMRRAVDGALDLLSASHAQDPNAPNTLISLAITYHLAGRYADEIPVLRQALKIMPDEPQVLRLALQAGIWGGDQALADQAMQKIDDVLPQMAPAARKFYEAAPPPPKLRPPG